MKKGSRDSMQLQVIVHEEPTGGYWAEVPALPGCMTQGETLDEVLANVREAVAGWLAVDVPTPKPGSREQVFKIAV
jgi:predicted RNase H-like HicB family nuclease